MVFREAEREFDLQIEELMDKYNTIPVDDMASIMNSIRATPFTQAYINRLEIEFSKYASGESWDSRRSGR